MFQGASALTLDPKGRLSMPSKFRDALAASCEGRLTLTRHPDGCLLVYPRPVWEARREVIAQLSYEARALQRLLLGSATDVDVDSAGRVLVAPELRTAAGMTRDVLLIGMGAHLELWDVERHAEREREQLPAVVASQVATGFKF
jgi:MraZ protein